MQPLALVVFGVALAAGFAVVAERVACRSPKSLRAVLLGGVALLAGAILVGQVLPFLGLDRLYTLGTILIAAVWSLSFVAGGLGVVMLAGGILATRHAIAQHAARSPGVRGWLVAGGVAALVTSLGLMIAMGAVREFTAGVALAIAAALILAAGVATLLAVVKSKRAPVDQSSAPPPGAR